MVTLDTNIAIYAFTDFEPKARIAADAIEQTTFVSVQLLNEFANVMRRKRHLPYPQIATMIDQLRAVVDRIQPIDEQVHREGMRIAERYQLAIYDAFMVAAALGGGATTLFSEDMQHGLVVDERLIIRDPFRTATMT